MIVESCEKAVTAEVRMCASVLASLINECNKTKLEVSYMMMYLLTFVPPLLSGWCYPMENPVTLMHIHTVNTSPCCCCMSAHF